MQSASLQAHPHYCRCPLPLAPVLPQVLAGEGVSRYDPAGEAFDPNRHNALFEVPDATKPPRTVAVVVKVRLSWRVGALAAGAGPWSGLGQEAREAGALGVEPNRGCGAAADAQERPLGPAHSPLSHSAASTPQRGYTLNERVVRAAEVGVTRAVDE